jgi:hypothetical protein
MARAYKELKKPDARPQEHKIYCSNCDEWDDISNWTLHNAWRAYDRWAFHDDPDENYYIFGSEPEQIVVYEHDGCSEWFISPDQDKTGDRDVWVCGNCGTRTHDQERARRCCT